MGWWLGALAGIVSACDSDPKSSHVDIVLDGGPGSGGAGGPGAGGLRSGGTAGSASGGESSAGGRVQSGGASGSTASTGGASGIGGISDGGATGSGGALPMRAGKACNTNADCPGGLCLLNICDEPGCGPTKGITEICDHLDNDCDGFFDNPAACGTPPCVGDVFEGHAYAFCGRGTFEQAEATCNSLYMHLARVDSDAELKFIAPHFNGSATSTYWIGGSDLAELGTWRWLGGDVFWKGGATGSAQNGLFASWSLNQPTDSGSHHVQRCLGILTGGFNDEDCMIPLGFVCEQYNIAPGSCFDVKKNGDESDVDCGGSCAPCTRAGQHCRQNSDCASSSCSSGVCAETCQDKVKNGTETDVDCGGACPRCTAGLACQSNDDCGSRVCTNGACATCDSTVCPGCDSGYKCCSGTAACGCTGSSVTSHSCEVYGTHI